MNWMRMILDKKPFLSCKLLTHLVLQPHILGGSHCAEIAVLQLVVAIVSYDLSDVAEIRPLAWVWYPACEIKQLHNFTCL